MQPVWKKETRRAHVLLINIQLSKVGLCLLKQMKAHGVFFKNK